jgi:hypothetical protein
MPPPLGQQRFHAGQQRRPGAKTGCLPGNGEQIDVPGTSPVRCGPEAAVAHADDLAAGLRDDPEAPVRARKDRREIARIRLKIENVSTYALDSGQIGRCG